MTSPSVTRASLLLRIRDPGDRLAWGEFVQLYAPLIHAYGMHRGLQDADAADVVQEVLRRVSRSAPQFEYDRARGSFRGWLLTVTRNEIRKMAARKARQASGSGDTQMHGLLEQHADDSQPDADWDREYRWNSFLWAAQRVKSEFREATWRAFWLTVVEGQEIERAAKELKLSLGAVYIARSRVIARIRQEIQTTLDE
jgi:RNA polymerase sigma-70 factor (ECF subfamily)